MNDPTDEDLWGGYLNDNMDSIDTLLHTAINYTPTSSQTSNFSVTASDFKKLFRVDSTSGNITASIVSAATAGAGFVVAFIRTDNSANTITLDPAGTETINGATTVTIENQYDIWEIVSDGTNWLVIGKTADLSDYAPLASPAFTGNPTAPTPSVGDSDTSIATTAFVDPARSHASDGYQKFSSGLIIQWGQVSTPGGITPTVTFPVAFSSAVYSVTATIANSTSGTVQDAKVSSVTTTGFVFKNSNYTDVNYWMAIGK